MLCPTCQFENFEGDDNCANCGADLALTDVGKTAFDYHDSILGDHLEALGIGDPMLVEPDMPVADAIRAMHQGGRDCLLVCEDGRLVGIFTDRDAVAKAIDKRLALFHVRDFMTPDPVVLRPEDTIAVAIHKMAVGEFRHIPVVDDGRPLGVVAAVDVFRHLVRSLG